MATASRWDPFREMERMFGTLMSSAQSSAAMPLDLFKTGDHYILTMDLPGVDPGTIDCSVDDKTLTIRAERTPRSDGDAQWLVRERPSGTFARQLTLGRGLALDKISASYQDGVLVLTIPVAEEAMPRRIEVNRGHGEHEVIGTGAEETIDAGHARE